MESLNGWLDKVEKEIARQEVLTEDADRLKTQINAMRAIKTDVDDHNRPVNNTLDIIAELVETGADVLSSSELNSLQVQLKDDLHSHGWPLSSTLKLLHSFALILIIWMSDAISHITLLQPKKSYPRT